MNKQKIYILIYIYDQRWRHCPQRSGDRWHSGEGVSALRKRFMDHLVMYHDLHGGAVESRHSQKRSTGNFFLMEFYSILFYSISKGNCPETLSPTQQVLVYLMNGERKLLSHCSHEVYDMKPRVHFTL